jgi:FlaA1/EpsC-like NDP-sugar epimerase
VREEGISDVLLALPSASRARRNAIIQSLEDLPVHVRTLPSMGDLARGRVTVKDFRELDIEDLLGREPVAPRADLLAAALALRVVLGRGSIGGELSRQILQQPRQLICRPQRVRVVPSTEVVRAPTSRLRWVGALVG